MKYYAIGFYIIGLIGLVSLSILSGCTQTYHKACTMEAKICPDGSSVGRTGPNCEFTACPNITPPGKLQAFDCTDRNQTCTSVNTQVCGQVQVECIRAPCPPIKETFANKCDACRNQLTISYTLGACENIKP